MNPEVIVDEKTGFSKVTIFDHELYLMPAVIKPGAKNPECQMCYFNKKQYEIKNDSGVTLCGILYDKNVSERINLCFDEKIFVHPNTLRSYLKTYAIRKLNDTNQHD